MKNPMTNGHNSLDGALNDIRKASVAKIEKVTEMAADSTTHAIKEVEKSVHRTPWYFIGGAAALAGALGFMAGRKFKN